MRRSGHSNVSFPPPLDNNAWSFSHTFRLQNTGDGTTLLFGGADIPMWAAIVTSGADVGPSHSPAFQCFRVTRIRAWCLGGGTVGGQSFHTLRLDVNNFTSIGLDPGASLLLQPSYSKEATGDNFKPAHMDFRPGKAFTEHWTNLPVYGNPTPNYQAYANRAFPYFKFSLPDRAGKIIVDVTVAYKGNPATQSLDPGTPTLRGQLNATAPDPSLDQSSYQFISEQDVELWGTPA